jgi:hypothetical protein
MEVSPNTNQEWSESRSGTAEVLNRIDSRNEEEEAIGADSVIEMV